MMMLRLASVLLLTGAGIASAQGQERPTLPPDAHYFEDTAYSVFEIADGIYGIGEPTYWQNNMSYLLVGDDQALLFDGGASRETDMRGVVASLTDKPVAVLPSHLHFDHLGGAEVFDVVWLVDLPFTRGFADASGVTHVPLEVDLNDFDNLPPTSFKVSRYVAPDEVLDLGGLEVQVLWTGGHTKDEIALWVPDRDVMLTADFLYPSVNFVGNTDDLLRSLDRVLGMTDEGTRFLGGHGDDGQVTLPEMTRQDLMDTKAAFEAVRSGQVKPTPVDPNEWLTSANYVPINDKLYAWENIVFRNGVALDYE